MAGRRNFPSVPFPRTFRARIGRRPGHGRGSSCWRGGCSTASSNPKLRKLSFRRSGPESWSRKWLTRSRRRTASASAWNSGADRKASACSRFAIGSSARSMPTERRSRFAGASLSGPSTVARRLMSPSDVAGTKSRARVATRNRDIIKSRKVVTKALRGELEFSPIQHTTDNF